MYYDFFNLKEHPFRLTCEPKYFYLSPEHTHANAMLEFALIKRQGIMLLTGEVGTGKTMLVQHFLSRLDNSYKTVSINQTQLSAIEFLQLLLLELDEHATPSEDAQRMLAGITEQLEKLHRQGEHSVIIVDEAQNLCKEVLMHLHDLSQHRIDKQRVCTIFLVGQNKIRETLEDPAIRDVISNINAKYHLGPLNLKDIRKYILHRLAVAGGHKSLTIDKEVFPIIETYTGGRPRLINVISDHILTYAYMEDIKDITSKVVDRAIEDLQWLPFGVQYGGEQPKSEETFQEERRQSYKVIIRSNNRIQGEYFIRKKRISIGRHRSNDLRIDDPLISRQHAQILQQGRTIYLRDLNSTNGSYVNSKRVDIAPLEEGTVIKIGNCHLTFTRNSKPSAGNSAPREPMLDFAATRH